MKPFDTRRRQGTTRRIGSTFVLLGALACTLTPALAQKPRVPDPNAPRPFGADAAERQELNEEISKTTNREQKLEGQLQQAQKELVESQQRSIQLAREVQKREAAMTTTEERLRQLLVEENGLLRELKERQQSLSSILAALQLMERNKPPALVVRPNDAVNAARTAMLLGSILPRLKTQADNLGRELQALVSLRQGILDQREKLAGDRKKLEAERQKLADVLEQKKSREVAIRKDLEAQRRKLAALARRARNFEQMFDQLDEYEKKQAPANRVAGPPGTSPAFRGQSPRGLNRRLAEVKGKLRPPVTGTLVRRFREEDRVGRPSQGVTLRTRPGAQVVAPFDSTIMFAQPYRGYGQLLILSTGDGYHFVLAGMTKIYGVEGQKLLEGEPVGVMGASEEDVQVLDVPRATGAGDALSANAGPELYFEIRKDGEPINPLPWLATARLERTAQ